MKSLVTFIIGISLFVSKGQGRIYNDGENKGRLSDVEYQFLLRNMNGLLDPKRKPTNDLSPVYGIPEENYGKIKLAETEEEPSKVPFDSRATDLISEMHPFERNRRTQSHTDYFENCTETGPCLNVINLPSRLVCSSEARDNWTACSIGGQNFAIHKLSLDSWQASRSCKVAYKFENVNNKLFLVVNTRDGKPYYQGCYCETASLFPYSDALFYVVCFKNPNDVHQSMSSSNGRTT